MNLIFCQSSCTFHATFKVRNSEEGPEDQKLSQSYHAILASMVTNIVSLETFTWKQFWEGCSFKSSG